MSRADSINPRSLSSLLLLALIALLPWQGALRFPTHSVTVVKLVGAVLFVAVLLATLLLDRPLRLTAPIACAVLLCTALTLSLIASGLSAVSTVETLRYWTLTLFLFLVVQLLDTNAAFLRALRVLACSAIVGAVWATVQFLDGSVARASGPISDPNDFAYFLAAMLPFVLYLFMSEPSRRWLWGAGAGFMALGILGSSSRGAFVALGVTALWALSTRRVSPIVVVGSLSAVALLAVGALAISTAKTSQNLHVRENGLSESVSLREVYWSAALRMTANHPILGIGPGQFEALSEDYVRNTPKREQEIAVNSTYLGVLSEGGTVSLLLFIAFLAAILRQILMVTRREGSSRPRAPGRPGTPVHPRAPANWLRSAFLASFVVAVSGGVFFSAQLSTPLWLLAAFSSALAFARAGESSSAVYAKDPPAVRGGGLAPGAQAPAPGW
jgi:putative inorganic carbon (HCO3(-)) transporter